MSKHRTKWQFSSPCGLSFQDSGALNDHRERCAECEEIEDDREVVFTNCNVCGRKLHTTDEEAMGMCAICADE